MKPFISTVVCYLSALLLSACATAISPDRIKADGKHSYFVLDSVFEEKLKAIDESNKVLGGGFARAVFVVDIGKKNKSEPYTRQYDYRKEQRVYELKKNEISVQIKRMGTLESVYTQWTYQCQNIGIPGKPGYSRVCNNIPQTFPVYRWEDMNDTPVLNVGSAGLYLYGQNKPDTPKDGYTHLFLEQMKQKAQTVGIAIFGF